MIEEFKDIIVDLFEKQGKTIQRDNIVLLEFHDVEEYYVGLFTTTLPDYEYYKIIYNVLKDEFVFSVYQKTKVGKATRNNGE